MHLVPFFIVVVLLVVAAVVGFMYQFPRELPAKHMQCQRITGVVGAEDIVVDQHAGIAYIPSQDRRPSPQPPGVIYKLDLNKRDSQPVEMKIISPVQFHPHGVYLYEEGGQQYLFVANFGSETTRSVELFQIDDDSLHYLQTFTDPRLISPNAIYVINLNEFYVTNYSAHNVLHCKNNQWDVAVNHIPFANGINGYASKHELVIVSTLARKMYMYHIDPHDGRLLYIRSYSLQMFGDGIRHDMEGNYWVTGHPNSLMFLLHSIAPQIPSPSYVVKIDRNSNKVIPIFYDSGAIVSGASVAVRHRDMVLIGSVFEPFIIRAEPYP